MKILMKRIRTLDNYLVGLSNNDNFHIALTDLTNLKIIQQVGFTKHLNIGEQILPSIVGRVSYFNSNGGFIIHRNLPKVTVYRQADITDWHGNYHTVDIPYQRYPRTAIPAPFVELTIVAGPNGQKIIRSPQLTRGKTPDKEILHVVNLFLELFGECDTVQSNLLPVFNVPITRLNWNLLPPGAYPWKVLKNSVQQAISNIGVNRRHLVNRRLEIISAHVPNFVAIGNAGFRGYIVFGFPNKNFFVLESLNIDNATYVFGQNWQQLSQLTKEQILNQNLHINRLIHNSSWEKQINNLF